MKQSGLILTILSIAVWMSCGGPAAQQPVVADKSAQNDSLMPATFTLMSFNVLHPTAQTSTPGEDWETRRRYIVDIIRDHKPDILLLQEVVVENGNDTADWMRKTLAASDMPVAYDAVGGTGTAPKDILVNREKFEVLFPSRNREQREFKMFGGMHISNENKDDPAHNTIYLPPDPLTTCLSAINQATPPPLRKTASFAHLRHRATNREFVVTNLHLHWAHESRRDNTIRIEQLRCINSQLHQRFAELPKIVGGDFNAELSSEELNLFQGGFGHKDRRFTSAATDKAMPQGTWNGFCENCTPALKIDHIFTQNIDIDIPTAAIHTKVNNHWPSDHCPIIATLKI